MVATRRSIYDRARAAMVAQLRKVGAASEKARKLLAAPAKPRGKPLPPPFHPHESRA